MPKLNNANDLESLRSELQRAHKSFRTTLTLCGGTGCQASRSRSVIDALKKELSKQGLDKSVCVRTSGCHGFCEQGPLMVIEPGNIFYCHITPEDVPEIISQTVLNNGILEKLLYTDPITGNKIQTEAEIPFYKARIASCFHRTGWLIHAQSKILLQLADIQR